MKAFKKNTHKKFKKKNAHELLLKKSFFSKASLRVAKRVTLQYFNFLFNNPKEMTDDLYL